MKLRGKGVLEEVKGRVIVEGRDIVLNIMDRLR